MLFKDLLMSIKKDELISNMKKSKYDLYSVRDNGEAELSTIYSNVLSFFNSIESIPSSNEKNTLCVTMVEDDFFDPSSESDDFLRKYFDVTLFDDNSECPVMYGLTFSKWNEWATYNVSERSLEAYGALNFISCCLYEMSFFGYTIEDSDLTIDKEVDTLNEIQEDIDSGNTEFLSSDDFFASLGVFDTRTAEDKENSRKNTLESCAGKELMNRSIIGKPTSYGKDSNIYYNYSLSEYESDFIFNLIKKHLTPNEIYLEFKKSFPEKTLLMQYDNDPKYNFKSVDFGKIRVFFEDDKYIPVSDFLFYDSESIKNNIWIALCEASSDNSSISEVNGDSYSVTIGENTSSFDGINGASCDINTDVFRKIFFELSWNKQF